MDQFRQAYFINQIGSWPDEVFVIAPSTQFIDPNLGFLPIDNNVFYLNNTLNKLDNSFLPIGAKRIGVNSLNNYIYNNSLVDINEQGFLELDFSNNSFLTWNVSAMRRAFDTGSLFNMNQIDVTPGANFDDKSYYGYLIFPSKICLRPERLTFSGGNWSLATRTVVRTASTFYTYNSTIDTIQHQLYQRFTSRSPLTAVVPSGYTLMYDLCALRTQTLRPVINFTETYNPQYVSELLEPNNCRIRPDSTSVFYDIEYFSINPDDVLSDAINIAQDPPIFSNATSPFRTSYLFNYDPYKDPTKQYFQLVQRIPPGVNTFRLSESGFAVLSAVFDLNTSNFRYFSNFFLKKIGTIFTPVNTLTGIPQTSVRVNYTVECPTIYFTNESAKSGATISGTTAAFGTPTATGAAQLLNTFTTKYPPHFYSYKVAVSSSAVQTSPLAAPRYVETDALSFYLTTSAISGTATSVTLSTYIASDFNFLTYDLGTTSPNDFIKYTPVESDPIYLSAIKCFYGLTQSLSYNIFNSPWVPLVSAKMFSISYPTVEYGEINFALKTTLSSVNGFLDNKIINPIKLAAGLPPADLRPPLEINIVDEGEDYIDVDCSFANSESFYPFRDLTDSYISWTISPTSVYTSINAINVNRDPVAFIPYLSATPFNENSWTVRVSGFGPQTTIITLSSQKYNLTSSITSNSALFNYFAENRFIVGPSIALNNLNTTRTLRLTAAVPYKNRVYTIPTNTYMSWEWTYDGEAPLSEELIKASYVSNTGQYVAGLQENSQNLSSINIEVTPPYADLFPNVHRVVVTAYSYLNVPPIEGSYSFNVDDFPHPSIFNADFVTTYINGLQPIIADTRQGINVVTRGVSSSNSFSLSANSDVFPTLIIPSNGSIVWSVSNNVAGVVSTTSFTSGVGVFYNLNLATGTIRRQNLVTLSAVNCLAPGWTSAHSVQANTMFYIIPAAEFTTLLDFNLYPTYIWQGGPYLTLLDNSNYTLATSPTAYANKISNSQSYAVSTNKPENFDRYLYGANNSIFSILPSSTGILDIPYSTSIYDTQGLPISITAYGKEFPEILGTTYVDAFNRTWSYPNYGSTLDFLTILPSKVYRRNPKLIPYDNIYINFTPITSSIDLDNNRFISVYQTISSNNNPTQPLQDLGTVTYILSTNNWSTLVNVPASNGIQNIYFLNVGDPYITGNVNGTSLNTIYLKVSGIIPVKIPASTFNNYDNIQYQDNRELWTTVQQYVSASAQWTTIMAYSTAVEPEIYLSDYYSVTGQSILVQFYTPNQLVFSPSTTISAYFVNFGEDTFTVQPSGYYYYQFDKEGTFYPSYSALYNNGFVKVFNVNLPIIIKNEWPTYNQEDIRILDETILTLPYTSNEVEIQPNEWGDVDIFNTAIGRIYDNLEYLKANCRTINTDSPTIYYGWLGTNRNTPSQGIRWFTQTYGNVYYTNTSDAIGVCPPGPFRENSFTQCTRSSKDSFSQINGIAASSDHIYVLDGSLIRGFSAGYIPVETTFSNISQISAIFVTPQSLAIDETGTKLYCVDSSKNQVFKFDIDITSTVSYINVSNTIGTFGYRDDYSRFNAPAEVIYRSGYVYVLDYNNYCVKQYNADLNWLYTYYTDSFSTIRPIAIAAHPINLLYVLTEDYNIHVFDQFNDSPIQTIKLTEVQDYMQLQNIYNPKFKIILDENGEFLYIVVSSLVFKYTATGYFLSNLNIPDSNALTFYDAAIAPNHNILFSTSNSIVKVQDVLEIYRIGEGLPTNYWSKDQILLKKQELAQDIAYNRALKRMAQNLKTFRNNLNSKFVIKSEITDAGTLSYFALEPIKTNSLPSLDTDVENENLFVGVNELHVPQSINKELVKLYNSLTILSNFLTVETSNEDGLEGCPEPFCWSWKATSCYNLKLPIIRICGINPITYDELKFNFPVNYAPSKVWGNATSNCCKDYKYES